MRARAQAPEAQQVQRPDQDKKRERRYAHGRAVARRGAVRKYRSSEPSTTPVNDGRKRIAECARGVMGALSATPAAAFACGLIGSHRSPWASRSAES